VKSWVKYSVLRLVLFAVVLVVLLFLLNPSKTGTPTWLIALIAAIVSLCISYLVLGRQRNEVALTVVEARQSTLAKRQGTETGVDEEAEDGLESDSRPEADPER
jgi:uncharacterized membrane protein